MTISGQEVLLRPHLGLYTQPLSFIGLPVLSVPIQRTNALPVGVQLIAAPDNEAKIAAGCHHTRIKGCHYCTHS